MSGCRAVWAAKALVVVQLDAVSCAMTRALQARAQVLVWVLRLALELVPVVTLVALRTALLIVILIALLVEELSAMMAAKG